jgi:protein O-mannosyl-transferase
MYASAETLWRATVAQEPKSWMAQNNLGVALMECDRNEEAVGHFQEALKGNPDRGEVLGNLGKTYIRLERATQSLPYLLEAKECAPNRPDVLSNLGRALYQTGHLDDAVANLEKALDINPNYVPALSFSGAAFLQKGCVEEAERRLRRAVEIEPENKLANLQLADALRQLGRPEEAFLHLHKALGIDPNSPEAEKNLAWVLATDSDARNRDGARAVALAKHANRLNNGRDPVINVTLAAAYAEMGRFPEAIKTVEVAQQMAVDVNNVALAEGILGYLELYRSGRPFRSSR